MCVQAKSWIAVSVRTGRESDRCDRRISESGSVTFESEGVESECCGGFE